MNWLGKAMVTAATVAALLVVARLFGRRLAGILAGLPAVTGPAPIWLAIDRGTAYAIEASIGSITACAMCAVFALVYERASQRCSIATALPLAAVASVLPGLRCNGLRAPSATR